MEWRETNQPFTVASFSMYYEWLCPFEHGVCNLFYTIIYIYVLYVYIYIVLAYGCPSPIHVSCISRRPASLCCISESKWVHVFLVAFLQGFHGFPVPSPVISAINIPNMALENKEPLYWLVVYLPLWKIWKSVGMIIPNIWKNKKCSKHRPVYHVNSFYVHGPVNAIVSSNQWHCWMLEIY